MTTRRVSCPTCSMEASTADLRLLAPVSFETTPTASEDLRRCRNCGDIINISLQELSGALAF